MKALARVWSLVERTMRNSFAGDVLLRRSQVHARAHVEGKEADWPLLQFLQLCEERVLALRFFYWGTAALVEVLNPAENSRKGRFAMDVGFIGAGSMGSAMIPNLVKAGHAVSVWNRDPEAARKLEGITILEAPAEAFAKEAVVTMLSDDRAVQSVILDSGVLHAASKSCVHVMMATISPAMVETLQQAHRSAGVGYVAAPVFGIPAVAQKGELNIMAAGDPQAIAKVQPLFDVLGQKTWPLGEDPKHANIAKIAGNLMITLAIEAMGEATALTESYGLKAGDFLNIVTSTMFASPSYKRYGDNISQNRYEPGFKLTLGLKDVHLALDAAKAKNAELGAAQVVRENMQHAIDEGLGDKDWSVLAQATQRRAGVKEARQNDGE